MYKVKLQHIKQLKKIKSFSQNFKDDKQPVNDLFFRLSGRTVQARKAFVFY